MVTVRTFELQARLAPFNVGSWKFELQCISYKQLLLLGLFWYKMENNMETTNNIIKWFTDDPLYCNY
jgi:hypothetical protein